MTPPTDLTALREMLEKANAHGLSAARFFACYDTLRDQLPTLLDELLELREKCKPPNPEAVPDNSMVICPHCTCQFRAIPVEVQAELRGLRLSLDSANAQCRHLAGEEAWLRERVRVLEGALASVRAGISESSYTWLDEIMARAALAPTQEKP